MKVKLGPYRDWVGPYQIADMVFFWLEKYPLGNKDQRWDYRLHDRFGNWLAETWVADVCQWIHDRRRRTVKVKIDSYDVWSVDHTMALIILPLLKQLKIQKQGYGWIDDEDVPEHIRSTAPGAREGIDPTHTHEWDHYAQDRYEWVLTELIWTFRQLSDDEGESQFYDHSESNDPADDINAQLAKLKVDRAGLKAHWARIDNGLVLFGKYFRTLWD